MLLTLHRRKLMAERLEQRHCLSALGFSANTIAQQDYGFARSIFAADLDGDDDVDMLTISLEKTAWHENRDGRGDFGPQEIISVEAQRGSSAIAADIDGDGDMDVLSASEEDEKDGKIAWYENTNGLGRFGPQRIIDIGDRPYEVLASDLDGDGDLDVIENSRFGQGLGWYENTNGKGQFGPRQHIRGNSWAVSPGDLDGDGDIDLVVSHPNSARISWLENTDGLGSFKEDHLIDRVWSLDVQTHDVDNDGDLDVVTGSTWHDNTNGDATSFSRIPTIPEFYEVRLLAIGDIDNDGQLDLVASAEPGAGDSERLIWYSGFDKTNRQEIQITSYSVGDLLVDDIDRDGDLDVAWISLTQISWFENRGGFRPFEVEHVIAHNDNAPEVATIGDIDGDDDLDVLAAMTTSDCHDSRRCRTTIGWFENTDGSGAFGEMRSIADVRDPTRSMTVGDLDGDGDSDLVVSFQYTSKLVWYQNIGQGAFAPEQEINIGKNNLVVIDVIDIDRDDDVDLVFRAGKAFGWFENTDGRGSFDVEHVFDAEESGLPGDVGDLDSDGDNDLILSNPRGPIRWYENTDGKGNFDQKHDIDTEISGYLSGAVLGDLDSDGDLDVIIDESTYHSLAIGWHENLDGRGTFGPRQIFATHQWEESGGILTILFAEDMDGDGDVDVLARTPRLGLHWYENLDGKATFSSRGFLGQTTHRPRSVAVGDLDGDGATDVVAASRTQLLWHESRTLGDVNNDGRFDTTDLVLVFQAGKYEDGIARNASFAEGDWNGDDDFDTKDLIAAFQAGMFVG